MSEDNSMDKTLEKPKPACISRRNFLLAGSASFVCAIASPGMAKGKVLVKKNPYPRKKIASLSQIISGEPIMFQYPQDDITNYLIKLDTPAGGGIGKDKDIVAFNTMCSHMGGPLIGLYKHEHKAIGPCPLHLTSFDLSRFGIVAAGQATESLPQIELEIEGDDVFAIGVMGLLYGKNSNI